jgi:hypothetical protein
MPERNPVAFAVVGSAPMHELASVNEHAETRIVRSLAGGSSKSDGGSVIQTISSRAGFWIAGKRIDRRNRYDCRPR